MSQKASPRRAARQHSQRAGPGLGKRLRQLESTGLIRMFRQNPELEYMFRHGLVQEAVYKSLLKTDRRQLLQTVAETMEGLYPDQAERNAPILALHYAEAGDDIRALHYTLLSADAANRVYAYAEASAYYSKAIEMLSSLPNTEENRRQRIEATLRFAETSWAAEPPLRRLAYLAEAEKLLSQSMSHLGTSDENRVTLMRLQLVSAGSHTSRNDLPRAIHYYQEVLAQAEALGEQRICMTASAAIGTILMAQGYFNTAEPILVRVVTQSQDSTDRWEWASTAGFLGVALAIRGQIATGITQVQNALSRAQAANHRTHIAMLTLHLTLVYWTAGDTLRMREAAHNAVAAAVSTGDQIYACIGFATQALAESLLGESVAATASMAHANRVRQQLGGAIFFTHLLAFIETQIAFDRGNLQETIGHAETTVLLAQSLNAPFIEGITQRLWALALTRVQPPQWDEAEAHMAESLRALESGGALLEVARTHAAWSRICLDRGKHDAAREHAARAKPVLETVGLARELHQLPL